MLGCLELHYYKKKIQGQDEDRNGSGTAYALRLHGVLA